MDLPGDVPVPADVPPGLGLGDVAWYGKGRWDAIAVLADAEVVRTLDPDLAAMASLGTRSVIVTAPGDRPGVDCVSRVFGPNVGIDEDPVTGSAHCTLATYWGDRLDVSELVGEQASPRGGMVRMRRQGDRVVVAGQAVTVSTTQFVAA
jgi:PhzF family phenazine biosynthesis protein